MVYVHLDLTFTIETISQHSSNPTPTHWKVVKQNFHYVKGTQIHGLLYFAHTFNSTTLVGFYDANWAGEVDS
jgi:hypothetical protein